MSLTCSTYTHNDPIGGSKYISGTTCGGVVGAYFLTFGQSICMNDQEPLVSCDNLDISIQCGPPTPTATPTPTVTPTVSPTNTLTPTPTETPIPSQTSTPTQTPTQTNTSTTTPTLTTTPTNTSTLTQTPTPTNTPTTTTTLTSTPTNTLTATQTSTVTPTPTVTPTMTQIPSCMLSFNFTDNPGGPDIISGTYSYSGVGYYDVATSTWVNGATPLGDSYSLFVSATGTTYWNLLYYYNPPNSIISFIETSGNSINNAGYIESLHLVTGQTYFQIISKLLPEEGTNSRGTILYPTFCVTPTNTPSPTKTPTNTPSPTKTPTQTPTQPSLCPEQVIIQFVSGASGSDYSGTYSRIYSYTGGSLTSYYNQLAVKTPNSADSNGNFGIPYGRFDGTYYYSLFAQSIATPSNIIRYMVVRSTTGYYWDTAETPTAYSVSGIELSGNLELPKRGLNIGLMDETYYVSYPSSCPTPTPTPTTTRTPTPTKP